MEALHKILDNAQRINVGDLFFFIFSKSEVQEKVFELNTEGQLDKGILENGAVLPDYSETSVRVFGKPSGPIKLFDTGEFWRSFSPKVLTDTEFVYDADSLKTDLDGSVTDIVDRYASIGNAMGLNDDSIKQLVEFLKPLTARYIYEFITTR